MRLLQPLKNRVPFRLGQADANEKAVVVLLNGQRGERVVVAQLLAGLDLHAQVEHQVDLKLDRLIGQAKLGNLGTAQSADVVLLLQYGNVAVAQTGQVGGAADAGRPTADQANLGAVHQRQLLSGRQRWVANLLNVHPLEHLHGKVLQAADVDRPLLGGVQIAAAHAQVRGRADHAAGEAQRIVRQDGLGGAVVVLNIIKRNEINKTPLFQPKLTNLIGDHPDESFNVELSGTALLARRIGTLQTAGSLLEGASFAQRGVLDVVPVVS